MKRAAISIAITLAMMILATPALGLSGELVIEGTGESQGLLRELAARFMRAQSNVAVEIPETIGSTGGIKALTEHRIEVARISRLLTREEKKAGLEEVFFARTPVVFVVHPGVSNIDNITSEQVAAIYSGKVAMWDELGGSSFKIYPVYREPGSSARQLLEEKIPGLKGMEITPSTKTAYSSQETSVIVRGHKNTIGFMTAATAYRSGLRVLNLDGVEPSPANVENGKYPLVIPLSLVHSGKPGPVARAFVDFMLSSEARDAIRKYGSVPAKKRQ